MIREKHRSNSKRSCKQKKTSAGHGARCELKGIGYTIRHRIPRVSYIRVLRLVVHLGAAADTLHGPSLAKRVAHNSVAPMKYQYLVLLDVDLVLLLVVLTNELVRRRRCRCP